MDLILPGPFERAIEVVGSTYRRILSPLKDRVGQAGTKNYPCGTDQWMKQAGNPPQTPENSYLWTVTILDDFTYKHLNYYLNTKGYPVCKVENIRKLNTCPVIVLTIIFSAYGLQNIRYYHRYPFQCSFF